MTSVIERPQQTIAKTHIYKQGGPPTVEPRHTGMAASFVQQFKEIPPTERGAALQALTLTLTDKEVIVVQSAISVRHDPFARLSYELLIRTFDHLHPYDVWSKRRVSRRWNRVLSAEKTCEVALKRMQDHDPTDSGQPPFVNSHVDLATRIRHRQALRLGKPFSSKVIPDDLESIKSRSRLDSFALKGKYMAYLQGAPRGDKTVVVHDLMSDTVYRLCGEARENIMGIVLTSEVLAFATFTGVLYVASLTALPIVRKATRLPSSLVRSLAGDEKVIACLTHGTKENTIIMHDASRARTTSFAFRHQDLPQGQVPTAPECVIVNAARETIDLLNLVTDLIKDPRVYHRSRMGVTRFSFSGDILSQHVCTQGRIENFPDQPGDRNSLGIIAGTCFYKLRPAGRKGLYSFVASHNTTLHQVQYDCITLCFTIVNDQTTLLNPFDTLEDDSFTETTKRAIWKDLQFETTIFRPGYVYPSMGLILAQPCNAGIDKSSLRTFSQPKTYVKWSLPKETLERVQITDEDTFLEINDSFVVLVIPQNDTIQILCFDESICLHGAQPTGLWRHDGDHTQDSDINFVCSEKLPRLNFDCEYVSHNMWPEIFVRTRKEENEQSGDRN